MRLISRFFLLLILTSCGAVINYDYESSTDFDNYKTYGYYDDIKTGLSELDTKRLIRAIDAKLQALGFQRVDVADFYIDIQSQEIINRTNSNVGVGVGGTGGNVGGGVSVGIPLGGSQYTREIVIEFVDDSKNGTFWQATAETSFNPNAKPEKREAQFMALAEKILSKYPPQIK
jgi:hypothetical protein